MILKNNCQYLFKFLSANIEKKDRFGFSFSLKKYKYYFSFSKINQIPITSF